MKIKRSLFFIVIISLIIIGGYYNFFHLRKGMTREKALSILSLTGKKKFSAIKLKNQSKNIEVLFSEDRTKDIDSLLILVFENGKLCVFGKGRSKFSEILQQSPELNDLIVR